MLKYFQLKELLLHYIMMEVYLFGDINGLVDEMQVILLMLLILLDLVMLQQEYDL
jgi:hypothetical protein